MNRNFKKVLACLMAVIMLASAVPLNAIDGIDIKSPFKSWSLKASAVNTTYNAIAAAEYAKRYAINYNKEWYFYSNGGDCANFVSQALFAGGMPMTWNWHSYDSNVHAYRMNNPSTAKDPFTWIRAQQLCDYLASIGGQVITNPSASDFAIGDAVFYDWDGGRLDHSAIVTDIINGVPRVSAHSTPESASKLNEIWTYNRGSRRIVLVKLNGRTCDQNNSPTYDCYHMSTSSGAYTGPGYGYSFVGTVSSLDTVRVINIVNSGGRNWGYFNYRGTWSWVDLSNAYYTGHFDRIQVDHIFGNWFTVKQATCLEDGLDRHVCSRCGYTEDRVTSKTGHVEKAPPTCTEASYCKYCGVTMNPALGHDFTEWVRTKTPTCVQKEEFQRTCKRCNLVETKYGDYGNHNYLANVTTPGCTTNGTSTMKCQYCGDSYVEDVGDGWSGWSEEKHSELMGDNSLYQTKTQYSYSDKSFTTSSNDSLSGWTKYNTTSTWSAWGQWSAWQDNAISGSDSRQVETQQVGSGVTYHYFRYANAYTAGSSGSDKPGTSYGSNYYTYDFPYELTITGSMGNYSRGYKYYYNAATGNTVSGNYITVWKCDPFTTSNVKTQYRYRDRYLIYTYYYYKWGDYSPWQDAPVTANDNRQVKTKTLYRYKLAALNHDFGSPTVVAPKCTEKGYTVKTCKRCGFKYKYDYKNALGHDLRNDWYTVVEAAPGVEGVERRDCHRCDYFETRGHNLVPTVVEPTCTEKGYTLYKCSDDGCTVEYITDEVPALGHDLREKGEVVIAPTCEKPGLIRYTCKRCDYYKEEEVPALGHDYHKIDEKCVAPTCLEKGYDYYECSHASEHNYKVELDALGHDFDEWKEHKPETCGKEGFWYRDCKRDGCDVREEKDHYFLEHDYGESVTIKPTCCSDGMVTKTCKICGNIYIIEVIPALGHDFGEHVVVKEETCEEEGLKRATCSRCGLEDDIVLPPLGHDDIIEPITSTCVSESGVKKTCQRCGRIEYEWSGETDPDNHLMGEWYQYTELTCTTPGEERRECQRDGCKYYEQRFTTPKGHNMKVVEDTKPTCTIDGRIVQKCQNDGCDYEIITKVSALGHALTATVIEPTCTERGYTHYVCQRDGCGYTNDDDYVDALGHDWGNWYETKKATYDEPGIEQRDCHRGDASETRNTELVPKPKYTATFAIKNDDGSDKIVDQIVFEKGTKSIIEPDLPSELEKDNYTFYWDWDGKVEDKDFTVYGVFEKIESGSVSQVEPDKKAEYKDGIASITLSAFAKTKIIEFDSKKTTPVDVVLVLDQSGSMKDPIGKDENGESITRQDKLIESAEKFVNAVYKSAVNTGADHRVAMVGFAYSAKDNAKNTQILTTRSDKSITYGNNISDKIYKEALMSVNDGGKLNSHISNALTRIEADGATAADLGLDMAKNIFANNPLDKTSGRTRLVIFLTDGVPTSWANDNETNIAAVANNAIKNARILKTADTKNNIEYGAKIYSIGVNPDCDVDGEFMDGIKESGCIVGANNKAKFDFNRFLHYVSSNYPNANAMLDGGNGDKNGGYYMAVNDTESFEKSFENILTINVKHKVMFNKTTLVDTLSDNFTLTMEQEAKMRENLKSELGLTDQDINVTRNSDGTTTLRFDNIPVKKVFEDGVQSGYKATVSFDVTANDKTIEAGTYKTNTDDAGVMLDDEYACRFDIPEITVPKDRNILIFNINGETYSISEGKLGDKVVAPVTELAKWNVGDDEVVSDRVAIFEAVTVSETKIRTTWVVNGESTDIYYKLGDIINVPEVENTETQDFKGWSPSVPYRMPNYPITFVAKFGDKHEHSYIKEYIGGDCKTGLIVKYTCDCGQTYTDASESQEHKYTAVINDSSVESIEYFTCERCGKSSTNKLTFKCSTPTNNRRPNKTNTYFDLNLYDGEVKVQPGDTEDMDRVYISIPITELMRSYLGKGYKLEVYRIESNGKKVKVPSTIESNTFLVFEADHFSYYVICPVDPATGELLDDPSLGDAICSFDGHHYEEKVVKPTFKTDGYTVHTCTICGDTYTDSIVPANCDCICHKDNVFSHIIRYFYTLINRIFRTHYSCCDDMEPYNGRIHDIT